MSHIEPPTARDRYLAVARDLAPLIANEALIADRAAKLTEPVVEALADSGLYWAMTPKEQGGGDVDIVAAMDLIEEISRADGSTGWVYFVHMFSAAVTAVTVGQGAIDRMYGGDRLPVISGVLAPFGTAIPEPGGFRVTGKYTFGSGIDQADWMFCGALVKVDGQVELKADGQPRHLALCAPISAVQKLGNWNVSGLQATGSQDYAVHDVFVPEDYVHDMPDAKMLRGGKFFNVGMQILTAAGHNAVAIGIATRALEEIAGIAHARKRPGLPGVEDQQLFRYDFAVHDAALRAARAYSWDRVRDAVTTVEQGGTVTVEQVQRVRQACTYSHKVAGDAIRFAYSWAGTVALRRPSAVGNCLADISAAIQHKYVDPNTLSDAAPALLAAVRPEWA